MKIQISATGIALAVLIAPIQPAAAQQHVKVGVLRCEVAAGLGMIIASRKDMECRFTSEHGRSEHYYGHIQKFGIDIGSANRGVLA